MKKNCIALLVLSVLLLITFFPILFQRKVLLPLDQLNTMNLPYSARYEKVSVYNHFLYDALTQYYPYKVLTKESLISGSLAYWNPYIFGGYPQHGETMAAHFDITNIILLIGNMPMSYHLQIVVQLLIAGFGMYLLLKFFKISEFIAILFAAVYMLNSMFITTLLHRWILASFCWVPYIILMLCSYYERRKLYYLPLGSIFFAFSFMGGNFQTSAYIIFLLLVFNTSYVLVTKQPKASIKIIIVPIIIFLIGFSLSAIMWIPSLELLRLDILAGGSRASGAHMSYSLFQRVLSLPLLISFLIPEIVGSVRAFDLTKIVNASMDSFSGFIGFAPLLFGVWGAFFLWKKKPQSRPFTALAIFGLIVPLATPLYKYVYHRFFIFFIFGMIFVGAIALNEFVEKQTIRENFKKWSKYAAILFIIIFMGVILLNVIVSAKHDYFYSKAREYIQTNIYRSQAAAGNETWMLNRVDKTFQHFSITSPTMYVPFLCITAVFILIYFAYKKRLKPKAILIGFATITFIQLLIFARSWLPMIDPGEYPLYPQTEVTKFLQNDNSEFRVFPYFDSISPQMIFHPNILSIYKIPTISGHESIKPRSVESILSDSLNTEILGLANVKYILTNRNMQITDKSLILVYSNAIKVYQNRSWHPRAFMAYRYEVIPDDSAAYRRLHEKNFDGSTVIFEQNPNLHINFGDIEIKNNLEFLSKQNNNLSIQIDTEKEGYLVLSDTYYPGWKAFVNGREQEIMKANYAMRAITVPAGRSTVEYRFDPLSFKIGKWISLFSIFLCILLISISIFWSRKSDLTQSYK